MTAETAFPADSRATRSYAAMPRPKRSRTPRMHRRRMASRPATTKDVALVEMAQQFWNAHAIKSGILLFWVWFAAANQAALQGLLAG